MYEWVVNRLRNAEAEHTKHGEDKLAVLCRDAANAVVALNMHSGLTEAMHHNQQAQWIPVTDVLPEKRKYVLVRYKNNDMAVAGWFDGDENILFWRAMIDERWCANCDTEPTHWMPLPEPPKEEA